MGHLNSFSQSSNARELPGGMFNLRFDWHVTLASTIPYFNGNKYTPVYFLKPNSSFVNL